MENNILNLYENFVYTLKQCGKYLINENDDEIAFHLFEEFPIGCISFFHLDALTILLNKNMINLQIFNQCKKIRDEYLCIEKLYPELLNANSVRTNQKWFDLLNLSDNTLKLLFI